MKKYLSFVVLLASTLILASCTSNSSSTEDNSKEGQMAELTQMANALKGQTAPDFSLMGMDGKEYKMSELKGQKIYLKFWASWCPPCRESLPETEDLAKEEGRDFLVLSMIAPDVRGEQSIEDFEKWYKDFGYTHFPVLYDTDAKTMLAYQIRAFPSEAFIDSNGVIQDFRIGAISNEEVHEIMAGLK